MIKNNNRRLHENIIQQFIPLVKNKDRKPYGSKKINLIRISQEKKVKRLKTALLTWGERFDHITNRDRIQWRRDYQTVLQWERYLYTGLNNILKGGELVKANLLYKKYLGFQK